MKSEKIIPYPCVFDQRQLLGRKTRRVSLPNTTRAYGHRDVCRYQTPRVLILTLLKGLVLSRTDAFLQTNGTANNKIMNYVL